MGALTPKAWWGPSSTYPDLGFFFVLVLWNSHKVKHGLFESGSWVWWALHIYIYNWAPYHSTLVAWHILYILLEMLKFSDFTFLQEQFCEENWKMFLEYVYIYIKTSKLINYSSDTYWSCTSRLVFGTSLLNIYLFYKMRLGSSIFNFPEF